MAEKMDKKVLITGMVILGVIILALIFSNAFGSPYQSNTISAMGQSTIKVVPDFVSVYFNVQTTGITASNASDKNSEIVSAMKNSLMALGFEEDEIKTQGFSVYPDYEWTQSGGQKLKGYTATHTIIVQIPVSENAKIGKVIDAGVSAGAGISYINYELTQENQNLYKAQAIKEATEDATNNKNPRAREINERACL